MAPKKGKKQVFSVTKAVKANARERVGQPPKSRVLPDESKAQQRERKHRETLQELINRQD